MTRYKIVAGELNALGGQVQGMIEAGWSTLGQPFATGAMLDTGAAPGRYTHEGEPEIAQAMVFYVDVHGRPDGGPS
jgi:hypothetical protein